MSKQNSYELLITILFYLIKHYLSNYFIICMHYIGLFFCSLSYKLQYWLLGGDLWKSETKSTCHSFLLKIHYLHFRFVCILFLPLLNYFSIFGFLFETICRQFECLLECIEHAYIHTHTRNVYISKWKWAVCISVTHRIQ